MPLNDEICGSGLAIVDGVLDDASIRRFTTLLDKVADSEQGRGGVRNLLHFVEMRELAGSESVLRLVKPLLGDEVFAVRGILFDKKEGANWKVPWHQDVTIAVKTRIDAEGYGPWSVKQDVLHVQPPSVVMEGMLSVRLHLDDCPKTNGALRVIPGSHKVGKLGQESIDQIVATSEAVICEVNRGGALLMRLLMIHASSIATVPGHRRVIHFDYAASELTDGLQWHERRTG
jgi:ectoine hydroxylase-related dioxygenase (phytanoyl-CoA dioxygenase family)